MHPATLVTSLISSALLAAPAAADVITVGAAGDHADIQAAVQAASDGDVLLVEAGRYAEVAVTDKSVTIVAESGAEVIVEGGIDVRDLPADKIVTFIGLRVDHEDLVEPYNLPDVPGIVLFENDGAVRVEDCVIDGPGEFLGILAHPAARITSCADVAFARTELLGQEDAGVFLITATAPPPPAVQVMASHVVFHGGTIRGIKGGRTFNQDVLDGGTGLAITSGNVLLSGTTVLGGPGGDGFPGQTDNGIGPAHSGADGGDGGPALQVLTDDAVLSRLDCTFVPGPGGQGGEANPFPWSIPTNPGAPGPVFGQLKGFHKVLDGLARSMSLPMPVIEGTASPLVITGEPSEVVGLLWGLSHTSAFDLSVHGQVLVEDGFLTVLGNIPTSGTFAMNLWFPPVSAVTDGLVVRGQVITGSPGEVYVGDHVTAVVLAE